MWRNNPLKFTSLLIGYIVNNKSDVVQHALLKFAAYAVILLAFLTILVASWTVFLSRIKDLSIYL